MIKIEETERIILRELTEADASFIQKLVNTPDWLRYIGDRHIHNEADARRYLENGPLSSYREHGYGLWMVWFKATNTPIGICGLIRRILLDAPDIGFAFLPEYTGKGLGYEAAVATLRYADHTLGIKQVLAITMPENAASVNLLLKIGMQFDKMVIMGEDEEPLMLFSTSKTENDNHMIDEITNRFFSFLSTLTTPDEEPGNIHDFFIPEGLVIKNTGMIPEVFNPDAFTDPRKLLLTDGTLTDFSETELSGKTTISGRVAQRLSFYRKTGKVSGTPFTTTGVKTFQFIKTRAGWRISAVAWDDEAV